MARARLHCCCLLCLSYNLMLTSCIHVRQLASHFKFISSVKNKSEIRCCVPKFPSMLWRDLPAFSHISPWWIFLFRIGEVKMLSHAFTQESCTDMVAFQYVLKFVVQNWFNGFGFVSPLYLTVGLELSICNQKAFTVGRLTVNTAGRAYHNEDRAVETECDY
jgi:hypothetical protein